MGERGNRCIRLRLHDALCAVLTQRYDVTPRRVHDLRGETEEGLLRAIAAAFARHAGPSLMECATATRFASLDACRFAIAPRVRAWSSRPLRYPLGVRRHRGGAPARRAAARVGGQRCAAAGGRCARCRARSHSQGSRHEQVSRIARTAHVSGDTIIPCRRRRASGLQACRTVKVSTLA